MVSWMLQVQHFFSTLVLGLFTGLFFHFYWLLVKKVRPKKALITLTDLLFCLFWLLFFSGALLFVNAGELRMYVWLTLFLGGWLYKKFLSRPLMPVLGAGGEMLLKGCGFLLRIFTAPMGIFWRNLHSLWKSLWIKGKNPAENPPDEENG